MSSIELLIERQGLHACALQ